MEASQPILITRVADRVGTITLNRPERRNAIDPELMGALDAAVKQMAADPEVKVVVVTGAPGPGQAGGFCSGGDTKDGTTRTTPDPRSALGVPPDALSGDLARHDQHAAMLLHLMPKPTIAMVGGAAIGAGFSLAAACDLRFAADDAVFAAGFSTNGLSGDYGGTVWWTRIVGTAVARELYLLNDRVTAQRALELGMVNAVFPAAQLADRTYEVAARLVRTPASLLALVKDNLNQAEDAAERRRWLFANEAENQGRAGRDIAMRLRARQTAKPA